MATVDPTAAELAAMATVVEVATWCDMEGDCADENTVAGSMLKVIGAKVNTKPRTLSVVKAEDFQTVIANWRIPDGAGGNRAPTLVEAGQASLFIRLCHLVGGKGRTLQEMEAAMHAGKASAPPPPPVVPKAGRKFKMSTVALQGDETEVPMVNESDLVAMYLEYEKVYGAGVRPPKDHEPTIEQVSAVVHLLQAGLPPYMDFALFGPFGHRLERKVRLSGLSIGRDGTLKQVELQGPPNIGSWMASYGVLSTILVMTKTVDLGILQRYRSHIERLHDRYSEKIWAILYQAESRCRLELMDRLRRESAAESDAIVRAGGVSTYDASRPWNGAWLKAANHESFWREEVIEPAMLILTKVAGLNDMVEGDAAVKGASVPQNPRDTQMGPSRMATTPASSVQPRTRKENRSGRIHQVEEGKYTKNRTGYRLCDGFQTGDCQQTSNGIWCPQQWDVVHQCSKCLGNHPAKSCHHKDLQVPGFVKKAEKGKGRGKSKKGSGAGRAPY